MQPSGGTSFCLSGIAQMHLKYDAAVDPHLAAFHRNHNPSAKLPREALLPRKNKTAAAQEEVQQQRRCVSVLDLARRMRLRIRDDILAHNALERRERLSDAADVVVDRGDRRSTSQFSTTVSSSDVPRPNRAKSSSSLTQKPDDDADVPEEHQGKLRILEHMFELFELGQEYEGRRVEEEHYRIQGKLMAAKKHFEQESSDLRLQFACRMQRKQFREMYPKLRRASTLPSLSPLRIRGGGSSGGSNYK